ncbi:MAG TPA: phosphonate metabolism protein/1,5-bisphosphokinase (PRPP-forming) PhnN [Candidatus Cybelea sp.]|nr:phosphonate metabolism protein/1,5-bisphosphokinase (PRPP-forming) PhnN [Candidatus Cybelea sp.]
MDAGRLVYVMGPSGAGKDSVIGFARDACDPERVVFAHRYITRPVVADAENHIALTEREFTARVAAGWFALHWESHGLRYGIGCEVDSWIASGRTVVVNGSRAYLPDAMRRYPSLLPVLVTAPVAVLEARLQARARASDGDLRRRLDRTVELMGADDRIVEIDNSTTLAAAGQALLGLLLSDRVSS